LKKQEITTCDCVLRFAFFELRIAICSFLHRTLSHNQRYPAFLGTKRPNSSTPHFYLLAPLAHKHAGTQQHIGNTAANKGAFRAF
jgi:hypothetical protein